MTVCGGASTTIDRQAQFTAPTSDSVHIPQLTPFSIFHFYFLTNLDPVASITTFNSIVVTVKIPRSPHNTRYCTSPRSDAVPESNPPKMKRGCPDCVPGPNGACPAHKGGPGRNKRKRTKKLSYETNKEKGRQAKSSTVKDCMPDPNGACSKRRDNPILYHSDPRNSLKSSTSHDMERTQSCQKHLSV